MRPWDSLADGEKSLFARMAKVYAGFLSHADQEIGRLLDYLEQTGRLDNTIVVVVSDNGASGEGGPDGSVNENKFFNGIPDTVEGNLKHLDDLGSTRTYNHYPTGWAWAFNTPFKMWKRYGNLRGGTADPLIDSWPDKIKAREESRAPGRATLARHPCRVMCPDWACLMLGLPGEMVERTGHATVYSGAHHPGCHCHRRMPGGRVRERRQRRDRQRRRQPERQLLA